MQKDENLTLIYYIFHLVWDIATDLEKSRIVSLTPDGNSCQINFWVIPEIILEHSWQVCQIQTPCISPYSIRIYKKDYSEDDDILRHICLSDIFDCSMYTISVNNELYNQHGQYVLFLSNFGEKHILDQTVGITDLTQIILKYIYGNFSLV
jgi:hypothetical protein